MRFWDASAIVPLLVDQAATQELIRKLDDDPDIAAWWATRVECVSAISRVEREHAIRPDAVRRALERLTAVAASWYEVQPVDQLRERAIRLLRVHPLRTADAFQLAAAIAAAEDLPATLGFVTLDERLADAAAREGFPVVMPGVD